MTFTTIFFDLDATLYPATSGLWDVIRDRIFKFMIEELSLPEDQVPALRDYYWKSYGTTLEGLRIHHQVTPEDYLDFVHRIPLEDYLTPDPDLPQLLAELKQDLWVFTNSDYRHAGRVLNHLGITDYFQGVIDLYALDFQVKPNPQAYHTALRIAAVDDPTRCLMFDDLLPNLQAAKKMGFTTGLVGGQNGTADEVDLHLEVIQDMKIQLPYLF